MYVIRRTRNFLNKCPVRYSDVSTNYEILIKPKLSSEERQKILDALNDCNADNLKRFNISQSRIKNLNSWKTKKGPFRSLSDILEVEGLSIKILEKLCVNIIGNTNTHETSESMEATSRAIKTRKQFISPTISNEQIENLTNAVGLHVAPTGISWARMERNNNLLEWSFADFNTLPAKSLPTDTFNLAMNILNKIPSGDMYILESPLNSGLQSSKSSVSTHQMELTAMLLALINTSSKHNITETNTTQNKDNNCRNKVYYLKSRLPARLFRTLIGHEKVSALKAVSSVISENEDCSHLPCKKVDVEKQLQNYYFNQSSVNKELLGQSLMLILTFMELCINKNELCIKLVNNRSKIK